jgi:4-amino-4-deoxy-L-arabinose transferase-like glycosyltransferase
MKPGFLNIAQKYDEIYHDERFGLLCATLWMTALGIATALGMLISWPISLIVFPFAIAAQCFLQYLAITRRGKNDYDQARQEPKD